MIVLNKAILADFSQSSAREWLETNGIGGYASSTVAGSNSRRHHGLLVAALGHTARSISDSRYVLLSKLEETLEYGQEGFELATNQYRLALHPQGFRHISEFRLDPFPVWVYDVGVVRLEKAIFMVQGENTTVITYRLLDASEGSCVGLKVRPLIAFRRVEELTYENAAINKEVIFRDGVCSFAPYDGLPRLYLHTNAEAFNRDGYWYKRFEYLADADRSGSGAPPCCEDLYSYGYLSFRLSLDEPTAFIMATIKERQGVGLEDVQLLRQGEVKRRRQVAAAGGSPAQDELSRQLMLAADQFMLRLPDGSLQVLSGYHWAPERGIALAPTRIASAMRRYDLVKELILTARIGMCEEAHLWAFLDLFEYVRNARDYDLVKANFYPKFAGIIDSFSSGLARSLCLDPGDSLLSHLPTRRKRVDVNALWYNALRVMESLASLFGLSDDASRYGMIADKARRSFNDLFWNEAGKYLCDSVEPNPLDGSLVRDVCIRPGQILAVSLPFQLLPEDRERAVVQIVRHKLLTTYGLRTLDPDDRDYQGRLGEGVLRRADAYEQGAVWPWLLAHFITAYLKVFGESHVRKRYLQGLLKPFKEHMREAGLGTISEAFDGDAPHAPLGCIAHAANVAEILRACAMVQR